MSRKLRLRIECLDGWIAAVTYIKERIVFERASLPSAVRLSGENAVSGRPAEAQIQSVIGTCIALYGASGDIASAFSDAVSERRECFYADEDAECLRTFGSGLRSPDPEGQAANCERQLEKLRELRAAAAGDYAKKGRLYQTLGLLFGLLAVVVMV